MEGSDSSRIPWEIKGRLRKRVVLANVPSFRFSFRGSMRTYPRSGFHSGGTSECTLVPVFVPGEHPPKPPFWETTLLGFSEELAREHLETKQKKLNVLPAPPKKENEQLTSNLSS